MPHRSITHKNIIQEHRRAQNPTPKPNKNRPKGRTKNQGEPKKPIRIPIRHYQKDKAKPKNHLRFWLPERTYRKDKGKPNGICSFRLPERLIRTARRTQKPQPRIPTRAFQKDKAKPTGTLRFWFPCGEIQNKGKSKKPSRV